MWLNIFFGCKIKMKKSHIFAITLSLFSTYPMGTWLMEGNGWKKLSSFMSFALPHHWQNNSWNKKSSLFKGCFYALQLPLSANKIEKNNSHPSCFSIRNCKAMAASTMTGGSVSSVKQMRAEFTAVARFLSSLKVMSPKLCKTQQA